MVLHIKIKVKETAGRAPARQVGRLRDETFS